MVQRKPPIQALAQRLVRQLPTALRLERPMAQLQVRGAPMPMAVTLQWRSGLLPMHWVQMPRQWVQTQVRRTLVQPHWVRMRLPAVMAQPRSVRTRSRPIQPTSQSVVVRQQAAAVVTVLPLATTRLLKPKAGVPLPSVRVPRRTSERVHSRWATTPMPVARLRSRSVEETARRQVVRSLPVSERLRSGALAMPSVTGPLPLAQTLSQPSRPWRWAMAQTPPMPAVLPWDREV